jgi:hypothetical protein
VLTVEETNIEPIIATPYEIQLRAYNVSGKDMELSVRFNTDERNSSHIGACEQDLGKLKSNESRAFQLTIFPTVVGLISVSLSIYDAIGKQNYEYNNIQEVFVEN